MHYTCWWGLALGELRLLGHKKINYGIGKEVAAYLIKEDYPAEIHKNISSAKVRAHPPSTGVKQREREGRKGNVSSNFVVIQREEKRACPSLSLM